MAMLSRREHAFGAPKYIINRYNVHLARFTMKLHVTSRYTTPVGRLFTYKDMVEKLSGHDQHTLFTVGEVKRAIIRDTEFTADIKFAGFHHEL
jgi:hypothetical protein